MAAVALRKLHGNCFTHTPLPPPNTQLMKTALHTTAQLSVSDGLVEVTGPYGMLTAGKLVFEASVDDGKETMLFQNGVQLVYFQQ